MTWINSTKHWTGDDYMAALHMNHMASSLRAITRYHKIKMDEVNKIVQELWIKIYRGGGNSGCLVS